MGTLYVMGCILGGILFGGAFIVISNLSNGMWTMYHGYERIVRGIRSLRRFPSYFMLPSSEVSGSIQQSPYDVTVRRKEPQSL
jgi:hypothetical protein